MDYVRIIRSSKHVAWNEILDEEDLPWLTRQIDLHEWYPMESYERLGLAILDHVAGGDLELIRRWGRETVDLLHETQPSLFAKGDPRETFVRFDVLRQTLFDYEAVRSRFVRDGKVFLEMRYGMSPRAEEAACYQSMGFLERLLELSGAEDIDVDPVHRSWDGDDVTLLELCWRPRW